MNLSMKDTSFVDLQLTLDGDLSLTKGDMDLVSNDEFEAQQIGLIFRNILAPVAYMGRQQGKPTKLAADRLEEDLLSAIRDDDTIDSRDMIVNTYPSPDSPEILNVEVVRLTEGDSAGALVTSRLNFSNGSVEGYGGAKIPSSSVYDLQGTPVRSQEMINVTSDTMTIEIVHLPLLWEGINVYPEGSVELDADGKIVSSTKTITTAIFNYQIEQRSEFLLSDLFPEYPDLGSSWEVGDIEVRDAATDTILTATYDNIAQSITIEPTEDIYNTLFVSIDYTDAAIRGVSFVFEEMNSTLAIGSRFIFPHDRIFGKIKVTLNDMIGPGRYLVTYSNYPARV